MKALFLLPDEGGPSARFRGRAWIGPLRERGIDAEAVVWPPRGAVRRALLRALPDHDAVLLVRRLPSVTDALRLRAARRLVYDLDDAVCLKESGGRGRRSFTRMVRLRLVLHAADTVTAANETLRALAARWHPDARVLPAALDLGRYPPRPAGAAGAPPVLGWMGSRTNLPYLGLLHPALARLRRKRTAFVLRVVSDAAPGEAPVPLEYRPWKEEGEVAELHGFDVGLAPLPDDPWTRAKSGMKVLLYGAAALPVAASPVGANRELVREGESGFLCADDDAWEAALSRLLADAALRRRMGEAGRSLVEAERDLRAWVPSLLEALGAGHGS